MFSKLSISQNIGFVQLIKINTYIMINNAVTMFYLIILISYNYMYIFVCKYKYMYIYICTYIYIYIYIYIKPRLFYTKKLYFGYKVI